MAFIDDRGRLFGRVNLIDFALIAFVVALVPLGYGAYALLRTPPTKLLSVSPTTLPYKKGEQRVKIAGDNLRPFLKATVGPSDAKAFLLEHKGAAEIVFDGPPVGTYDLALFDFAEEVARLHNAIKIVAPSEPPVQYLGHLVGDTSALDKLPAGTTLPDRAPNPLEVVAVLPGPNGQRLATLRTSCDSGPCTANGAPVAAGTRLDLHVPGGEGAVGFVVDDVRVDGTWATVAVKVFGIPEVLELMKAGDVDGYLTLDGSLATTPGVASGAIVKSVDSVQAVEGQFSLNFQQALSDIPGHSGSLNGSAHMPLKTRAAVLSVPLQRGTSGWRYRQQTVRPGNALTFETTNYVLRALVLRVTLPEGAPADKTR